MSVINRNRIKVYATTFIAIYIVIIAALLIFRSGILDSFGKPIGTDFLTYYTGSQLALEGKAATAYDYPAFRERQSGIIGTSPPPLYWLYPPSFFLFILPLALLPYIAAWMSWLFVTGAGCFAIIRKIYPDALTLTVALAFPGTIQNILQGQNGFLSALFLGSGLLLLPTHPMFAGILLGMMTYKPHLALLLPVALLASRQWSAFGGFAIGAGGLVAASVVVFGPEIWIVYINNFLHATQVLQSGEAPLYKAPTAYAFATLLSSNAAMGHIIQAGVSVFILASIVWLWSREAAANSEKCAGLVIGILLFTPSAYDYDLAILMVPMAFMAKEIILRSKNPYEKWILVIVWITPLLYPVIAVASTVQFGFIVLALFFWTILRRAAQEHTGTAQSGC